MPLFAPGHRGCPHRSVILEGDLHVSVRFAVLSIRGFMPTTPQSIPISQIIRLEKTTVTQTRYNSCDRSLFTHSRSYVDTLADRQFAYIQRVHQKYAERPTQPRHPHCRYTRISCAPNLPTTPSCRNFSHKASGLGANLPRLSPLQGPSPRPPNPSSSRGPRDRKVAIVNSVLRTTAPAKSGFLGLESPGAARQKQENEEELRRLKEAASQKEEAQRERERPQREAEELAKRAHAKEQEYQRIVVQPIDEWSRRLETYKRELPSSLVVYLNAARDQARRIWHQPYLLRYELPISLLEQQSEILGAYLAAFRALVTCELSNARSSAKRTFRFRNLYETDNRLSRELGDLERDLQDVLHSIGSLKRAVLDVAKQFTEDMHFLKKESRSLHTRSRDLSNSYTRATAQTLNFLSDSNLLEIREELIRRGKWSQCGVGVRLPENLSQTAGTERYAVKMMAAGQWNLDLGKDLFRGAKSPETLAAFCALYLARESLHLDSIEIGAYLHIWRQHDLALHTLGQVSYLSTHQVAYDKLEIPIELLETSIYSSGRLLRVARILSFMRGTEPRRLARYKRVDYINRQMRCLKRSIMILFHSTFGHGLSALMLRPVSMIERSMILANRPFMENSTMGFELVDIGRSLSMDFRQSSPYDSQRLAGIVTRLDATLASTVPILKNEIYYSGMYSLFYGTLHRGRPKQALNSIPTTPNSALLNHLLLSPVGLTSGPLPNHLYPEQNSIPILYLQSAHDVFFASRLFRSSKVLALDAVMVEYVDDFNVKSSRLQFIMLASESKVMIVHARGSACGPNEVRGLREVLEDSTILKVGVNLPFVVRSLSQELDVDVKGYANLAGDTDALLKLDDTPDPGQDILAQLAMQHLGLKLPQTPGISSLFSDGRSEPLEHFKYLASRAYIPLQLYEIYRANQREAPPQYNSNKQPERLDFPPSLSTTFPLPRNLPRLGPVRIDSAWTINTLRYKPNFGRIVPCTRSAFLYELSEKLAISAASGQGTSMRRSQYLKLSIRSRKALQAYYLITMFDEPLPIVQEILDFHSLKQLYDLVCFASREYRLPLHKNHQASLQREVFPSTHEQERHRVSSTPIDRSVSHRELPLEGVEPRVGQLSSFTDVDETSRPRAEKHTEKPRDLKERRSEYHGECKGWEERLVGSATSSVKHVRLSAVVKRPDRTSDAEFPMNPSAADIRKEIGKPPKPSTPREFKWGLRGASTQPSHPKGVAAETSCSPIRALSPRSIARGAVRLPQSIAKSSTTLKQSGLRKPQVDSQRILVRRIQSRETANVPASPNIVYEVPTQLQAAKFHPVNKSALKEGWTARRSQLLEMKRRYEMKAKAVEESIAREGRLAMRGKWKGRVGRITKQTPEKKVKVTRQMEKAEDRAKDRAEKHAAKERAEEKAKGRAEKKVMQSTEWKVETSAVSSKGLTEAAKPRGFVWMG